YRRSHPSLTRRISVGKAYSGFSPTVRETLHMGLKLSASAPQTRLHFATVVLKYVGNALPFGPPQAYGLVLCGKAVPFRRGL
ncbi:MAG: hypothetical protein ABIV48_08440, partial [Pyrinomonadaceae bacterium]